MSFLFRLNHQITSDILRADYSRFKNPFRLNHQITSDILKDLIICEPLAFRLNHQITSDILQVAKLGEEIRSG